MFSLNQKPATGIGVFLSPGANALQVEKEVQKKVAQLAKQFPQDIKYDTPFDTTKFVQASIDEALGVPIAGFGVKANEKLGPACSHYDTWVSRIKATLDPNTASDPFFYAEAEPDPDPEPDP